ncbi:MAG: hypothetical protein AAGC60_05015 [Acidobacteriota bacterium]
MSSRDRHVFVATTVLGVVAALLVVATVGVFLQGWVLRRMAEEESRKVFERPYPALEAYEREQEQQLSAGYHWLDPDAGRVHLPIERAMELVVAEQGGQEASP